jgi:hypothetical protein
MHVRYLTSHTLVRSILWMAIELDLDQSTGLYIFNNFAGTPAAIP